MELNYYQIEQYIQGELSGKELLEFEVLLQKDEALRKKVNFYQYAESILTKEQTATDVDADKMAKINPILEEMRNQYFINKTKETEPPTKETKPKPSTIKRLLPYAALAAAAAMLIFFALPFLQNKSNTEIAEANFKLYPLGINQMGGDDLDQVFKQAQSNYNKGNFEEANKQFSIFLTENPKAPEVWLAKGCAAFKSDETDTALESFNKVIEIDDSGISHPNANWYLALCYLKKDDRDKAIHHLKKIKEEADNYKEAKRLLRKLE